LPISLRPEEKGMVVIIENENGFTLVFKIDKSVQSVNAGFFAVFYFAKCRLGANLQLLKRCMD
jgi:hypothetical protein